MNPDDRRVAFAYSWHFLVSSWTTLWRGLSRAYFGRGYLEEVNAGNANTRTGCRAAASTSTTRSMQ